MFGVLYAADGTDREALEAVAREFSPRLERCGPREIVLDLSGLARLFGDARSIGEELRRTAADRGLRVRVAIAGTRTAARLLVRHRAGLTVIDRGAEAAALAPVALALLPAIARPSNASHDSNDSDDPDDSPISASFRRWGLRTLGEVAALPDDEVAARLGQEGTAWQRLARGEDPRPLVPAAPEERFEQALDLEWPIEGLEPLSFVLGRLLEPLSAHLERRDRGAAVLHVRLHLTTREVYARTLELPVPMRDPRTLRTLALLDLESNPPPAAIDRVVVAVDPTPGRVVQFSLLTRPLPSPEQVSTLTARLNALMGQGRCGSPALVDSWEPGAFAMRPFAPGEIEDGASRGLVAAPGAAAAGELRAPTAPGLVAAPGAAAHRSAGEGLPAGSRGAPGAAAPRHAVGAAAVAASPAVALRRFRFPIPARVQVEDDRPARVMTDRRGLGGGRVEACAGPWRTSGGWWTESPGHAWDRDEWDVTLHDGATYRIFRERDGNRWFVEGIVD